MFMRNDGNHYGAVSKILHWGIAVLIIASIAFVEMHELYPKGSPTRSGLMTLHIQIGLLLFGLTALRLAWRAGNPPPAITPAPQAWEAAAASLMHIALYAAVLALPLLGVAMGQAGGKTVAFLGTPLPVFLAENKDLAHALKEAHELIGNVVIALVALHATASIWHHFMRKDNTLLRMMPGRFN
jgi:cytochrome b561